MWTSGQTSYAIAAVYYVDFHRVPCGASEIQKISFAHAGNGVYIK